MKIMRSLLTRNMLIDIYFPRPNTVRISRLSNVSSFENYVLYIDTNKIIISTIFQSRVGTVETQMSVCLFLCLSQKIFSLNLN